MSTYAKVAVAAAAVFAVGLVGLAVLRPGTAPGIGGPGDPSPAPVTNASPSPLGSPSSSPGPSLPALTEPIISDIHGISISGPAGWSTRKATEPWTTGIPYFASEFADVVYDDSTENVKFIGLASQALAGRTGEQWAANVVNNPGWRDTCDPQTEPVSIDGAPGMIAVHCPDDDVFTALVSTSERGYLIVLYGAGDMDWFQEILATVQLSPGDALDAAPSASPSGS